MKLNAPTLRLAGWYTLIMMCLSISFSVAIYQISPGQIGVGLRHQAEIFRSRDDDYPPPMIFNPIEEEFLQAQIIEVRNQLRTTLIILNGAILLVAGAISYFLARRVLKPIEDNLETQRQFTADASHELRTPLTAMRTEIEVALRDAAANDHDFRDILRSNLEEVQRLEGLTTGLLRLARHDNNGHSQPTTTVSIASASDEAIQRVASLAKKKGITLKRKALDGTVLGDSHSLVELLVILLDNAIKYSPDKTNVEISSQTKAGRTTITIADHGLGIRATDLPHIFDRFYRADVSRSKHRVEGFGLGLPIAKQIVEQHHGTIEVKSELGKGTIVTVRLPAGRT
ncbi:MAG: HAMP domain-containing sensor histidine kinase [Patescibacteria group bacterium]